MVIDQTSFLSTFHSKQYPTILTQDRVYFVAGVQHIGDTRGNIWGVTGAWG